MRSDQRLGKTRRDGIQVESGQYRVAITHSSLPFFPIFFSSTTFVCGAGSPKRLRVSVEESFPSHYAPARRLLSPTASDTSEDWTGSPDEPQEAAAATPTSDVLVDAVTPEERFDIWYCYVCGNDDDDKLMLLCEARDCERGCHAYCAGMARMPTSREFWYCNRHQPRQQASVPASERARPVPSSVPDISDAITRTLLSSSTGTTRNSDALVFSFFEGHCLDHYLSEFDISVEEFFSSTSPGEGVLSIRIEMACGFLTCAKDYEDLPIRSATRVRQSLVREFQVRNLDDTAFHVPRTVQVVDALTAAQPVKAAFTKVAVTTSMVETALLHAKDPSTDPSIEVRRMCALGCLLQYALGGRISEFASTSELWALWSAERGAATTSVVHDRHTLLVSDIHCLGVDGSAFPLSQLSEPIIGPIARIVGLCLTLRSSKTHQKPKVVNWFLSSHAVPSTNGGRDSIPMTQGHMLLVDELISLVPAFARFANAESHRPLLSMRRSLPNQPPLSYKKLVARMIGEYTKELAYAHKLDARFFSSKSWKCGVVSNAKAAGQSPEAVRSVGQHASDTSSRRYQAGATSNEQTPLYGITDLVARSEITAFLNRHDAIARGPPRPIYGEQDPREAVQDEVQGDESVLRDLRPRGDRTGFSPTFC